MPNSPDFSPTHPTSEELVQEGFLVTCALCGDPYPLWLLTVTKVDGGADQYICEACVDE